MEIGLIDIENLRKRVPRTKPKMAASDTLFGKTRYSEVDPLTVTRIASSQVEYLKRVKTYRTDMTFTVNNIKRQQNQLRRSLVHYSRKLRQSKKEREKREQESRKRKHEVETKWLTPIQEENDPISNESANGTDADEVESDGLEAQSTIEIIVTETNEGDKTIETETIKVQNNEDKHKTSLTPVPENSDCVKEDSDIPMPSIVTDSNTDDKETQKEHDISSERDSEICAMMTLTKNLQEGEYESLNAPEKPPSVNDFDIKYYSKKKRKKEKRAVNYSDLIRLHHSTNTKKLFNLVDKLSKHEVSEKGSTGQRSTNQNEVEPVRRNSLYYTINYGYEVPNEEPESEIAPITERGTREESRIDEGPQLPYNNLFSPADNKFWREIHLARKNSITNTEEESGTRTESKAERRRRRGTDLPLLIADYATLKSRTLSMNVDKPDYSKWQSSSISRYGHAKHLPPLSKSIKFK